MWVVLPLLLLQVAVCLGQAPSVVIYKAPGVALVAEPSDRTTFIVTEEAPEITFEASDAPGASVFLLGKESWERCDLSGVHVGGCPADSVHGIVRPPIDPADLHARAALTNGTIYGTLGLPTGMSGDPKGLCEESKFRLVLCASVFAFDHRPQGCPAPPPPPVDEVARIKSGSCKLYATDKSWCSTHHKIYTEGVCGLYIVLLVCVLGAVYNVLQDAGDDPFAKQKGGGEASSNLQSFIYALAPVPQGGDGQPTLAAVLRGTRRQHTVDMLSVHSMLGLICVFSAWYHWIHDSYEMWYQYVGEGCNIFWHLVIVLLWIPMYLSKRSHGDARPEARAKNEKYRNIAIACYACGFIVRMWLKATKERPWTCPDMTTPETIAIAYTIVQCIIGVPIVSVGLYVVLSTVLKNFRRASTTALQGVESAGTRARMLSTHLLGTSQAVEVEQTHNPFSVDSSADEAVADETSSRSDYMQKSLRRWRRLVGMLVVEAIVMGVAYIMRVAVDNTRDESLCLGCHCTFSLDDDERLFKYQDPNLDISTDLDLCTSYNYQVDRLTSWVEVNDSSVIAINNLVEVLKIVTELAYLVIEVTLFGFMLRERSVENTRQQFFSERDAAGISAMRAGDGAEAKAAFERCFELVMGPIELNYVTVQVAQSIQLQDEKANGDRYSQDGDHASAIQAYESALAAAPQCDMITGLLDQETTKLELQEKLSAAERSEKSAIMCAEPLVDVELHISILTEGRKAVNVAQQLLGRLQVALDIGEPGRLIIHSCKAASTQGTATSDAVVVCQDTKLGNVFTAKAIFAPNCWQADWETTWICFDEATKQHLSQQADKLRSVVHDRVARLVESSFWAFDTIFFCKFDELRGETLTEYLVAEQGSMLEHESIKLAVDVLSGLRTIHELNLVHGCVNPELLVHVSGSWKLQTWSVLRLPSRGMGLSPDQERACHYLAPEQASQMVTSTASSDDYNPRCDLYSVGVIMYRVLTGQLPVAEGETDLMKVVSAVRFKPAQDLRDVTQPGAISDSMAALVSQALQKDSFDRHDSAASMEAALSEVLLQSPGARYDIFISYRVKSEQEFAKALHQELCRKTLGMNGDRVRVYLDTAELRDGKRWDDGFVAGLTRSSIFLPIVSEGSAMPLSQLLEQDVANVDNLLLEWTLALRLEELGVVKSILPVLVGKLSDNGDMTRPRSFFVEEEEWGGRHSYATVPHGPTATKVQSYLGWWEQQVVTQVAARNTGFLGSNEIAELSTELGGQPGLTSMQIASAFGANCRVDGPTFLEWWRSDANPRGAASLVPPKTVKETVDGIKGFQGLGCNSLRRSGMGEQQQDQPLGGEALVQELAKRVLKVAAEMHLSDEEATASVAETSASPRGGTEAAAAAGVVGSLANVPVHMLQAELERRRSSSELPN